MKKLLTLILALSMLLAGSTRALAEEEFLIGLIPEENIFKQMKKHKPFADYMTKQLGMPVRFTILSRYPHIITRFVERGMDAAIFGTFTAVLAQESLGVKPLTRSVSLDGSTTTNGYVFTRKDTGIKDINGMRGKKVAFVDQVTATGYLYLISLMNERGVGNVDNFFKERYYTGSHDSTIYTVLSGKADVGVAKSRIMDELSRKDPLLSEELDILYKSDNLPDNTLCVRKDLPEELAERLKRILLNMHKDPEGQKVLEVMEVKQFVIAGTSEFEPVRSMARKAGINLKDFNYDY